jgi:precorrin-6A/cobalt-precorrin-6A reductase
MHRPDLDQPGRIWLLAGTGEGPPLATALRLRGWRVTVSVVGEDATRPYVRDPGLEIRVGPLGGTAAISAELERVRRGATPYRWVIDATHPFATRISADLARVCRDRDQPLLRLWRRPLTPPPGLRLTELSDLEDLEPLDLRAERLLLAIGARHLAEALRLAGAGTTFARVLPNPLALQLARAAGLPDGRLACHRPGSDGGAGGLAIERALLRRWRITAVLCRQSGSSTERGWQSLCAAGGQRLLLLRRPPEPAGVTSLPLERLLEMLEASAPSS